MAPPSVTTSSSSRLSQFGLYRSIDARTEEFLELSRRRQLRQGCARAAVSTVIAVTVVVVLIIVYQYGMFTSETTLTNNRRTPQHWQIINDSKEEGALKIISKQGDNKRERLHFLQKDTEGSQITEGRPALKDIEEYSNIKNYFRNFRNLMKLPNRTFPIEYKAPRIHYSKSLIKRADFINKFTRFQPLKAKSTEIIKNDYGYKTVKSDETEYNQTKPDTSTTQTSIIYSVKRKLKVANKNSINQALITDKQKNIRRNKKIYIQNIKTHHVANNVSKCEKNLLPDKGKVFTKVALNKINSTVNLKNNPRSSLKSTVESQMAQYIVENELCTNKNLLRHFLDKIISICKKSTPKAKCKMACCNKNKMSSVKTLNETGLNDKAGNKTTEILPRHAGETTTELTLLKDSKYLTREILHINVTTQMTTTIPGQNAIKNRSILLNSLKNRHAKNFDSQKYANIYTNINIFKTTNIFAHMNNTYKYHITPKTNITNFEQNLTESHVNQVSDVLNKQVTTTELTITTNTKEFSFSPLNILDQSIDVLDKGIGLADEDSRNESPSNFDDYFLPQKDYDHNEEFAKAIQPITATPVGLNNYEIVNGYKYFRPLVNSKNDFDDVSTNYSANVHVSTQKYEDKHSSYRHALFKPNNHATDTVGEIKHLRNDNNAYKTVPYKEDDDNENQSHKATNKSDDFNKNFKTIQINKNFSVHSTTARNRPLLYHAIKTLPFIYMNNETIKEKAKINQSINVTKLNNVILVNVGDYAKKDTDEIKPETFGAYSTPVKAIKASNKVAEIKSANYTTETPHLKNIARENTQSMDKWILYKVNKTKQRETFSTEAVGIDLMAEKIPPDEVIEEEKGSKPISVKKWFYSPPINNVMHQQVFDNEVRNSKATKEIQPRVKYSATLGFYIAPSVKDNKVFENILDASKITHEPEVTKYHELNVTTQLNANKVMEKSFTDNNSNAKGEQSKQVWKVDHQQQVYEVNRSENVPTEIVNIDAIDDIIQTKWNDTIINSAQTIKPKPSYHFTEVRRIMSSIKQKEIEQQSADLAVKVPEIAQIKTDSESRESSQETEFSSETSNHINSVIRSMANLKVDNLNRKIQTEWPKIKKLINNKLLLPRKSYSEENEDSSQVKTLPETTTHAQMSNNVCEKCEVSKDIIRKNNSYEINDNIRADIFNTKRHDNYKFLQPLKSHEAFESATKIENTTTQVKKLCDDCNISEEKGKSVDSAETMDYLDVESLNKKRNLEWIKEKRLVLNKIIKPRQSYHLRAGLPSYLEMVRNNFSNPNSIKDFDNNLIEEWL